MVEQPEAIKSIMPERYRVASQWGYDSGIHFWTGEIYALVRREDGPPHVYRFLANAPDDHSANETIEQVLLKNPSLYLAKGPAKEYEKSLREQKARNSQTPLLVGIWQDMGNNSKIVNFILGGSL